MKINVYHAIVTIGLTASLIGCDGESQANDADIDVQNCKTLEGRTYYSDELGEGGEGAGGLLMMHWSLNFDDGNLLSAQSDFDIHGSYECRHGQIIATINVGEGLEEKVLDFSDNLDDVPFNPFGGEELNYHYHGDVQYSEDCMSVQGKVYSNYSQSGDITQIHFSEDVNSVTLITGDTHETGHYVCDLSALYLHLPNLNNESIVVDVDDTGLNIIVHADQKLVLSTSAPEDCIASYEPVCGTQTVNCIAIGDETCTELFKTYSNQCNAESIGESILFEGECGDKEGQPIEVISETSLIP